MGLVAFLLEDSTGGGKRSIRHPPVLGVQVGLQCHLHSESTNLERQKLASTIEAGNYTLKFPIFSSMAKEWSDDANGPLTEQLDTDEYMRVVLDSVFNTLSPM
jgi:hypothetical protein